MNKALTTEKHLRIALLGYRSHPFVGGQGIYLHYLSKALANLGHEVVVFSGPPYPDLTGNVRLVKIPRLDLYAKEKPIRSLKARNLISYTDMHEWLSKLSGGFAEPYIFGRRLVKLYASELKKFDIIHDNQSLCDGLIDLQKKGCKVVATIHHPIHRDRAFAINSAEDWFHRILIKRWYRFLRMQEKTVSKLKHIVTVSEHSRHDIESHFSILSENIRVISNGIDIDIFKPLTHIKRDPSRIITTASSDQPLKGLHILLQALEIIHTHLPSTELLVIGKLKENSAAQTTLTKLPLKTRNKIRFISGITTKELVNQYASATIAVCPSLYEGFGMPALEAMACGVPLISSRGGALPEVVGDAGILVETGNSSALASECIKLLQDTYLRNKLSLQALKRIENQYCWQQIAQRYVDYYKSSLVSNVNAQP